MTPGTLRVLLLASLAALLAAGPLAAQEITATPGTYELVEGTSMQFDGRPTEKSGEVRAYRWSIVSGDGAKLSGADQARVTFHAPSIREKTRLYTLQLDLEYASGKPSQAQINLRVHRKGKTKVVRERGPWIGGSIGFGFGYLWGGWWPYPPLVVIPFPPPGIVIPPEALLPIAVPLPTDPDYDAWIGANPDWADLYDVGEPLPGDVLPEGGGMPEAVVQPEPAAPPEAAIEPPEAVIEPPEASLLPAPEPEVMLPVAPEPEPMVPVAPEPEPMLPIAEPEPMIMPADEPPMLEMPMDSGGFDGGFDAGGFDDGGFDGGFDAGGFDDGGFD